MAIAQSGTFVFSQNGSEARPLEIANASISLYRETPAEDERIGLYIQISAVPELVPDPEYPDDPDMALRLAPTFYTEWLDITSGDLRTRAADALDGYRLHYEESADPDAQMPAALYQDMHGGLEEVKIELAHLDDNLYRVVVSGHGEFGVSFAIQADAPLERIIVRHESGEKSPEAESELSRLFDFDPGVAQWLRRGSDEHVWFDLVATFPSRRSPE